jgi:hypothetical protein
MSYLALSEPVIRTLTQREPGEAIVHALNALLLEDSYLLEVDANERSITFRLAFHLQGFMPDWKVDCEYNRLGSAPKELDVGFLSVPPDDTDAITVFPDIVVHQRGPAGVNYLIIECKKTTSRKTIFNRDIEKLVGYKHQQDLAYTHALFLVLSTDGAPGVAAARWVD